MANTGCLRDYPLIFPPSTFEWSQSVKIPPLKFPAIRYFVTCNKINLQPALVHRATIATHIQFFYLDNHIYLKLNDWISTTIDS